MRPFGPKPADHPSIGTPCPICKRLFQAGDFTMLVAREPAGLADYAAKAAGTAYTARAEEVCYEHAAAIAFVTGEEWQPVAEEEEEEEAP